MKYSDISTFVSAGLTDLGYGTSGPALPLLDPGPVTQARLQMKTPDAMLFLTLGNGVGMTHEDLYESPFLVARVVGVQNDYEYAETLARDVDNILLAVGGNTMVGTAKTLFITRTSGAPQLIDFDVAERYHFQTTYITSTIR